MAKTNSEKIKEYMALEPVFNCYGQEKSLKLLEMQKAAAIKKLKELRTEYNDLLSSMKKDENTLAKNNRTLAHMYSGKGGADPMVMGGIANAIAGPGAGVYAALKTQNENAAAQAANSELAVLYNYFAVEARIKKATTEKNMRARISAIEQEEIPNIEKEIACAKKTKIIKIKEEDIEKHIHLNFCLNGSNVKILRNLLEVDMLGIEANIQWDEPFFEQNYGSARMDGSFFANFYSSGGYYIGSVKLVMPLFGVDGYRAKIGGGCNKSKFFASWVKANENTYDNEESYNIASMKDISDIESNIRIVPNNLWVVDMNF